MSALESASKPKVLFIEDNEDLMELYTMKFQQEGFQVISAVNGLAGWQKALAERPDIILLDILMPVMDGYEVLIENINNSEIDIPIVVLSNLGELKHIDLGYKLGAASYLVKANYTPAEVVDKVKGLLNDRSAEISQVKRTL